MYKRQVLSLQKLGIVALSIVVFMVCFLGVTFSALQASKTATGTITFTGDLAVAIGYGNNVDVSDAGDPSKVTLNLTPNYDNIIDASESNNIYLQGQSGQVASLKWAQTSGTAVDDLVFRVFSNDTSAYIKFIIELKYTPASDASAPATAQDWKVFPNFSATGTQISDGSNTDYSYYSNANGENLLVSFPEISTDTDGSAVKTFYVYYLNSDFTALQSFAPGSTVSGETIDSYANLNKQVSLSDLISDINFMLDGDKVPNNNDKFTLSITCDAAIYPSI